MKRLAYILAFWLTLAAPAAAQFGACLPGFCGPPPAAGCVNSGHAAAFLARTTGLDGTHVAAYTALLDGLDADALSCKIDVLHVYATQDSTTALLNLIQNAYNGTAHGAPAFTADQGFTGVDGSTTVYIDTNYNPNTAVAPNFVVLANHTAVWKLDNSTSDNPSIGSHDGTNLNFIIIRKNGGGSQPNWTFFCADQISSQCLFGPLLGGTNSIGQWLESRISGGSSPIYFNGATIGGLAGTNASSIPNFNMYTLAVNAFGTATGAAGQLAMAGFGGTLNATEITNYYNRLRTYMTAVGVP